MNKFKSLVYTYCLFVIYFQQFVGTFLLSYTTADF